MAMIPAGVAAVIVVLDPGLASPVALPGGTAITAPRPD
jgi:hypothetical protein